MHKKKAAAYSGRRENITMNQTPITVAICGFGSRGGDAYASYAHYFPEQIKIVAMADPDPEKREIARRQYGIAPEYCFESGDQLLAAPRLADVMIIATMDTQHICYALPALRKGYHLLLEKPISPNLQECLQLREEAHRQNRIVVVCHVLRYTPFYQKIHELLAQNAIGRLQTLEASENVAYWHFAHSFVRGNWRRSDESSPVILQKSCHDMDILRWLAGVRCLRLSSYGSLDWFKAENTPDPTARRCLDGCSAKGSCPYDCEKIYITNQKTGIRAGHDGWPCNVVTNYPTEENLYRALRTGPYGRCVYRCDNDVADHQTVQMEFEGGITASFTLSAFTENCYRTLRATGSAGELEGNMAENTIHLRLFGQPEQIIKLDALDDRFAGHGGGDFRMMDSLYHLLRDSDSQALTSIDASVESHVMAMAAEYSRLHKGESVELEQFVRDCL